MLRRFRALPHPWPDVVPDLVLRIRTDSHAAPAAPAGDAIAVTRAPERLAIGCDLMSVDATLVGRTWHALLTIHAPGWTGHELEHCFAIFVHKLLQLCDVVRLHGAAIELDGRTHVLLGDKGAGKSTLSLALGQAGGRVLADDQIVVRRRGAEVLVSGCDSNIRLTSESERRLLPQLLDVEPRDFAGTLKKEVPLDGLVAVMPYQDCAARRICCPRVGERFAVRRLSGRHAATRILDAIAPAHGFASPADRWHLVTLIGDFAARAECFELDLSPHLDDLDRAVEFFQT